jgi:hypothetical protein
MREGSRQSACPMLQIFKDFPELIDPELDLANWTIDWNDQRDSPLGNTVNPAQMDVSGGDAPRVLLGSLQETNGLVLDLTNRHTFFTDLNGSPMRPPLAVLTCL